MFNKQQYLRAKVNNFYIDIFENGEIDQEKLDSLISELDTMESADLFNLCEVYEIPFEKNQFFDRFGRFMG